MKDEDKIKYALHRGLAKPDVIAGHPDMSPKEVFERYIDRVGINPEDCHSFVRVNGFEVASRETVPGLSASVIINHPPTQFIYEVRGLSELSDDAFEVFTGNRNAGKVTGLFYRVDEGRQLNERAAVAFDELKAAGLIVEMDTEKGQLFHDTELAKTYPWLTNSRSGIPRCFRLTEPVPESEENIGLAM
jgi:hypothetical protein